MTEKSVAAILVFRAPSEEVAVAFQDDFGNRVSATIDALLDDWPDIRQVENDRGRQVIAALVSDIPGLKRFETRGS